MQMGVMGCFCFNLLTINYDANQYCLYIYIYIYIHTYKYIHTYIERDIMHVCRCMLYKTMVCN